MNQPLMSVARFRSGRTRAMATLIFLGIGIFADVVGVLANSIELATGNIMDPNSDEINVFILLELGLGLLMLTAGITTIVLFCMWLYRVADNLTALGHPRHLQQYSPGWAVGSFFVPFVNLVIPYRAVREVWVKSGPDYQPDTFSAYSDTSTPIYFKLWWGFWLASNVINNIATRAYFGANTRSEMSAATQIDIVGSLLTIPAAVFAIMVVKSIDQRQEERSRRVQYMPNLPPPPPVFNPPANVPPATPQRGPEF